MSQTIARVDAAHIDTPKGATVEDLAHYCSETLCHRTFFDQKTGSVVLAMLQAYLCRLAECQVPVDMSFTGGAVKLTGGAGDGVTAIYLQADQKQLGDDAWLTWIQQTILSSRRLGLSPVQADHVTFEVEQRSITIDVTLPRLLKIGDNVRDLENVDDASRFVRLVIENVQGVVSAVISSYKRDRVKMTLVIEGEEGSANIADDLRFLPQRLAEVIRG